MQGQRGFWDVEDRLKELSAEGDPLERLGQDRRISSFSGRPWSGRFAAAIHPRAGGLALIRC